MKTFLFLLTALALVVTPALAERTHDQISKRDKVFVGDLLWSSLSHTDTAVLVDTLLGGAADTTSALKVAGARRVTLFANVTKVTQNGDIAVYVRTSPDGSIWTPKTLIDPDSLDADAANVRVYPLLITDIADTSDAFSGEIGAQVAGAAYIDFVTNKTDGTTTDSAMVKFKYVVEY